MKILVHVCCISCAIRLINHLKNQGFCASAFYYNPNIHPKAEYDRRLAAAQKYFDKKIDFIVANWEAKKYFEKLSGLQKKPARCLKCYELRLEKTFEKARILNINSVTTTLLVSKLQYKNEIERIGNHLAKKYKIKFISQNFENLFEDSLAASRQSKVYMQNYCGCIYSLIEKYEEKYRI